jgi:hypothetical protein
MTFFRVTKPFAGEPPPPTATRTIDHLPRRVAVSRLSRLSVRAYGRLTLEQRRAVDQLRYGHLASAGLDAASRGEAKTVLGWRRTAEETAACARKLVGAGMMPGAAARRLDVDPDYLRRLLEKVPDVENEPRNPSTHPGNPGLTDNGKGVGRPGRSGRRQAPDPHPDPGRVMYAGDESYNFEAALRRASSR